MDFCFGFNFHFRRCILPNIHGFFAWILWYECFRYLVEFPAKTVHISNFKKAEKENKWQPKIGDERKYKFLVKKTIANRNFRKNLQCSLEPVRVHSQTLVLTDRRTLQPTKDPKKQPIVTKLIVRYSKCHARRFAKLWVVDACHRKAKNSIWSVLDARIACVFRCEHCRPDLKFEILRKQRKNQLTIKDSR